MCISLQNQMLVFIIVHLTYFLFINVFIFYFKNIESDESSSSSSDGESDKCPICLTRLGQQDLASPDSCLHTYCLNCLTEWAKVKYSIIIK